MAQDIPEDSVVTDVFIGNGVIRFCLGPKMFRYDRLGLSAATE